MINLKENIWIKEFDTEEAMIIMHDIVILNGWENLYSGRISELTESVGKEWFDYKFGETKINNKPIITYKDYAGFVSKSYPYAIKYPVSDRTKEAIWVEQGRQTTKYFHDFENSIKSACNKEFCVIYRK